MKTILCTVALVFAPVALSQPLRYESAFADYKPWQDIRPADWRRVNDAVREAARAGAAAASAPATSASAPAPAGHAHHGMHGGAK
jgi:hypothetical protein